MGTTVIHYHENIIVQPFHPAHPRLATPTTPLSLAAETGADGLRQQTQFLRAALMLLGNVPLIPASGERSALRPERNRRLADVSTKAYT